MASSKVSCPVSTFTLVGSAGDSVILEFLGNGWLRLETSAPDGSLEAQRFGHYMQNGSRYVDTLGVNAYFCPVDARTVEVVKSTQ